MFKISLECIFPVTLLGPDRKTSCSLLWIKFIQTRLRSRCTKKMLLCVTVVWVCSCSLCVFSIWFTKTTANYVVSSWTVPGTVPQTHSESKKTDSRKMHNVSKSSGIHKPLLPCLLFLFAWRSPKCICYEKSATCRQLHKWLADCESRLLSQLDKYSTCVKPLVHLALRVYSHARLYLSSVLISAC